MGALDAACPIARRDFRAPSAYSHLPTVGGLGATTVAVVLTSVPVPGRPECRRKSRRRSDADDCVGAKKRGGGVMEMSMRQVSRIGGLILVLVLAGPVLSAPTMVESDDGQFSLPTGQSIVFYSQLDDPSGYALVDQAFEATYAAYSAEAADDFTIGHIPGTGDCTFLIQTMASPGIQSAPPSDPASVSTFFYSDAAGRPGALLEDCRFPGNTSFETDGFGDLMVTFDLPCPIDPFAHHWVSQQVRQDFLPVGGQHSWATRASAESNPAVWRNPGNGFGTGCSDWQPANSVCGARGQDMLFELVGIATNCEICVPCCGEGCADGVPASSPVGLVGLALALGGAAAWVLRRERRES